MTRKRAAVLVGVLVVVGGLGARFLGAAGNRARAMRDGACNALAPKDPPAPVKLGGEAPDFELADAGGRKWSLKALRGRPVLLNFWATWCAPCVEEMPTLETLNKRLGDQLVILTVSVDEDWEVVKKFFGPKGTQLSVLLDANKDVAKRYGSEKYPETFLIDAEGRVQRFFWQAKWDSAEATVCLENLGL